MSGIRWNEQGYFKSALLTGLLCAFVFTLVVFAALRYQAEQQIAIIKMDEYAEVANWFGWTMWPGLA